MRVEGREEAAIAAGGLLASSAGPAAGDQPVQDAMSRPVSPLVTREQNPAMLCAIFSLYCGKLHKLPIYLKHAFQPGTRNTAAV